MKPTSFRRGISLLLVFCMTFSLALGCTGCGGAGGGASAASMFLRKTEGTVAVADAEGAEIAPAENLGLYSGYTVGTEAESYAWIDLDQVKLTKLDENSAVEITKDGKNLSINVTSGSLFFNVTEPLADDETMEISTSSMLVGIRGTCGWVEAPDSGTMRVYILEGKVECTAGGNTATVNAGEMAEMTVDGAVTVKQFTRTAVPGFVVQEFLEDDSLKQAVGDASGIHISGHPMSDYEEIVRSIQNSFRDRNREILFAEEIDFEVDGSPEFLVIYAEDTVNAHRRVLYTEVYRLDQEQGSWTSKLPFFVDPLDMGSLAPDMEGVTRWRISLVEKDGRPYILYYRYRELNPPGDTTTHIVEKYEYWGSAAQNDGDWWYDWGYIESAAYYYYDYHGKAAPGKTTAKYTMGEKKGEEFIADSREVTAGEYDAVAAQYTEVRVIASGEGK